MEGEEWNRDHGYSGHRPPWLAPITANGPLPPLGSRSPKGLPCGYCCRGGSYGEWVLVGHFGRRVLDRLGPLCGL